MYYVFRDILEKKIQYFISVFIISRLNDLSNNSWSLQNEISVFENNKVIESVVYNGANIIPLETNEESRVAFAQYLLDSPRRASSIVGDKTQVLDLWNLLKPDMNLETGKSSL